MKADCLSIVLALDGQTDFLKGLFGSGEKPEPAKLPPLTPADLFASSGRRVLRAPR